LTEREKETALAELESDRSAAEKASSDVRQLRGWFNEIAPLVGGLPLSLQGPEDDAVRDVQRRIRDRIEVAATAASMEGSFATASMENARIGAVCQRLQAEVRMLKNQLQEMRGHVRVFVRFPPGRGIKPNANTWCKPSGEKNVLIKPPQFDREVDFAFDKVFPNGTSQDEVFHELRPVMESVVDGFDTCVLAYGQTGTGKTYTMEGNKSVPGIMQLGMELLFDKVAMRPSAVVSVSILEIYNEEVRDLLVPNQSTLEIRIVDADTPLADRTFGAVGVPGLTNRVVSSAEELSAVLRRSWN
jgi:hypothetical protein